MLLEIRNISKHYKSTIALHDISLKLENGVYGLVGPNGAGKTTLINILVNVLEPTSGNIFYNGDEISLKIDDYLDNIGYLPQYPKFYKDFKCLDFLKYMCVLKGIPKSQTDDKVTEVLTLCNLLNDKHRKIKEFSGGMRQRLGIAQAIINDPKILILDEPTAGLDPKERIRFRNIISNLSLNRIVILATHIMEDVESIAKEVILIQNGNLLGIKDTKEMLHEIEGNVWIKTIDNTELADYEKEYKVSNVIHEGASSTIRYISTVKQKDSINVQPKLEEVYLYYFEE